MGPDGRSHRRSDSQGRRADGSLRGKMQSFLRRESKAQLHTSLLLTTYYLLLCYLLLTTDYLLLTAYCLLLTAYYTSGASGLRKPQPAPARPPAAGECSSLYCNRNIVVSSVTIVHCLQCLVR